MSYRKNWRKSVEKKIKQDNLIMLFLLIPFFHPRGFSEFIRLYKLFFTLWLYVAVVIGYLIAITKLGKKCWHTVDGLRNCIIYTLTMASITILVKGNFDNGLQKIFATPALCIIIVYYLKTRPEYFIKMINNILSFVFFLNLTIFSPFIFKGYFSPNGNLITFLGHVQINAQLGMVGFLYAYLEYSLYKKEKRRFVVQLVLALLTMMMSFTSAAYVAIMLLFLFWLINKTKMKKIFTFKGIVYLCGYLLLNIGLFLYVMLVAVSVEFLGLSLNGRGFIWKEAINSFMASPVWGYGVHGIKVKVFWSAWTGDGQGLNYMHNQILQILNDGGFILFIVFLVFLYSTIRQLDNIRDKNLRFWSASAMLIILIVMIFESTMDYFYVFVLFMTLAYLPQLIKQSEQKGH